MPKDGLRRAHLGKYEGGLLVNEYVHALTLEGWGDGTGDVSEMGHYYHVLDLGPEALERVEEIAAEQKDTLTDEERALIRDSEGAIITEDEQGFVDVEYYDTEKELDAAWDKIEDEVEEFYEEAEAEE